MPTYVYACTACAEMTEAVRRIAERNDCPKCSRCYGDTERRITATALAVFTPYRAVANDKDSGKRPLIRTKAEHSAYLRRNGFEEIGNDRRMAPKPMQEIAARRAQVKREQEATAYEFNELTHLASQLERATP